jgi:hypothetical protein
MFDAISILACIVVWPRIFTTNTLGTNVYKMYECDKNKVPYCNVKVLKK